MNPKNKNTFIYPITIKDLETYPDVQNKILNITPDYSFSTADKHPLKPIIFIFDLTDYIHKTKKLYLYYSVNVNNKNKRIKLKTNIDKIALGTLSTIAK